MKTGDVLTNEFFVRYDQSNERLLIHRLKDGQPAGEVPIALRLSTLKEMGKDAASKWVGETLLLLVPAMRENYSICLRNNFEIKRRSPLSSKVCEFVQSVGGAL